MKDEILLERLKAVLTKLENGEHVQNRKLKGLLGEEMYRQLENSWDDQLALRDQLNDKPEEIIEYERRLKLARFAYDKADYNSKKKPGGDKLSKTETGFERLIEYLEEIIHADPSLQEWFDRDLVFGLDSMLSPSSEGVPRVVTSKSLDKQGVGLLGAKTSKNRIKIEAVKQAIAELESDEDAEQQAKLIKAKLAALLKSNRNN